MNQNKNREIKFRIWDISAQEYLRYDDSSDSPEEEYEPIYCPTLEYRDSTTLGWAIKNTQDYIVQQFTGLKINGVEIYEGDIVNTNGGNHIIEWRGAGFACTWSDYNLDSCWFMGGGPVVMGNVFENPELADRARKGPRA